VNLKDKAGLFGRFDAAWTPTVLVMSPRGVERSRLEGYLDHDEFRVWLEMGLARVELMAKKFAEAETWYRHILEEHTDSHFEAEAMYWRAVCQYNQTHDAGPLQRIGFDLYEQFPDSIWAMKTNAWLPADHPANRISLR
jgi:hypothetical protein